MLYLASIQPLLAESKKLIEIQQWILENHPDVQHIDSQRLNQQLINHSEHEDSLVIFDVREEQEYEVSHISKAIRIDPEIDKDAFLSTYSSDLKGKIVVFYCSVGRRSSVLAQEFGQDLRLAGASEVANLKYGIFGWHNLNYPLETKNGNTDYVHPYSGWWSGLINRKNLIRYELE